VNIHKYMNIDRLFPLQQPVFLSRTPEISRHIQNMQLYKPKKFIDFEADSVILVKVLQKSAGNLRQLCGVVWLTCIFIRCILTSSKASRLTAAG